MKLRTRLEQIRTAVALREASGRPGRLKPTVSALRTPTDILTLLESMSVAVQSDPFTDTVTKARVVGQLAALGLKAIETTNLAARLEQLEMVLKQRSA